MILVDANLPVHAVNLDSPFHPAARAWWDATLSGLEPVCLAWTTVLGFVRITTDRRIVPDPLSPARPLGPGPITGAARTRGPARQAFRGLRW